MAIRIVLLGGPGAGKGTQAARIVEREGIPHISTGEMFRAHMNEGTELGQEIGAIINQGHLVPDELTLRIMDERLSRDDCANGYVLDGFPRTTAQAKALDALLARHRDGGIDVAIELHVEDDEVVRRLTARRSCPTCSRIYNLVFSAPADDELCDDCKVQLIQREDDTELTIRERLKVYHKQTEPILDYYNEQDILRVIDGAKSPEDIAAKIHETLEEIGVS